jgi:hypothetical protein
LKTSPDPKKCEAAPVCALLLRDDFFAKHFAKHGVGIRFVGEKYLKNLPIYAIIAKTGRPQNNEYTFNTTIIRIFQG